jgi:hypothetical protein
MDSGTDASPILGTQRHRSKHKVAPGTPIGYLRGKVDNASKVSREAYQRQWSACVVCEVTVSRANATVASVM